METADGSDNYPMADATPIQRASSRLATSTLVAACFAVMAGQIGVAVPATLNGPLQTYFHLVGSQLTWISAAYLLPVVVLELTFGVLGDLYGRKRLMVGGGVLLAVGEAFAATAGNVQMLWVGQALAGLGAGALFPMSLTMVAAATHTARARARAIAVWAGSLSAGGAIAPILGGITGTFGSWRWSLALVAVLAAVSVLLSQFLAEDSSAPEGRSLDWAGQVTLALGLVLLLYAVIQGPTDRWDVTIIIAFVLAVACFGAFLAAELRARSPLLRLDLFRNRAFTVASIVAVIGMFSFLGTAYVTSIRLGPIQHQSPLRTVLPFLLLQAPAFVLIPVISRLVERINPRWLLGSGFAIMAAGQFLAIRLEVTDRGLSSLVIPIGLVGIGFALAVSSITAASINTVPLHYAGMASATTNLLRDFGFTLGPAVVGAVALSKAASAFAAGLPLAHLPAAEARAAQSAASEAGPLAVNSLQAGQAGYAARAVATSALGHGYAIGYGLCGFTALVAATLTVLGMNGTTHDHVLEAGSLIDEGPVADRLQMPHK
ncbi:MAG TPA: MFS transporter [Kribbella sp.]|jgi:MFS family permease